MEKLTPDEQKAWRKMAKAEPRLAEMLAHVRGIKREIWATREDGEVHISVYASVREYLDYIKPRLEHLVGWGRKSGPAFLQTRRAYDLAIQKLWDALPYDFSQDEIEAARERAYEAELEEGEWILVGGRGASRRRRQQAA